MGGLSLALLSVEFLDELSSGLPIAGAYTVQESFGIEVAALTLTVFVMPQLFALLVEAPLLVWAERRSRRQMLCLGLAGQLLSLVLCATADGVWTFGAAWALFFPSSGLACALAQATLMDENPRLRDRRMAEWALLGNLGDLTTPGLLWAIQSSGGDLPAAFVTGAGLIAGLALWCLSSSWPAALERPLTPGTSPLDPPTEPSEPSESPYPSLREALQAIVAERQLLIWLVAVGLCSFMDEVLGALVALRVHATTGSPALVARELSAFTLGAVLGLLLFRRLLETRDPRSVLSVSCLGCVGCYAIWLGLDTSWTSSFLMLLSGGCAALHYPIVQARAYEALPERATLVAAAAQLVGVFDLVLPLGLGWLVDYAGLDAALATLTLQPLGLLLIVLLARRYRRVHAAR